MPMGTLRFGYPANAAMLEPEPGALAFSFGMRFGCFSPFGFITSATSRVGSTTATTATAVGNATITAGVGTLSASNYDFSNLVNGTLTINKAPLTVTANNAIKTYGDANPTLSATVSGFVNGETAAAKNDGCAEEAGEREWTEACNTLEDMIHDTVPAAKLFKAKSLCKELLKNPQFCLDTGGRMMHLVDKPKVKFSVLDYILVAIRQAGPSEMNKVNEANYRLYRLVTKLLLNRNTPTQLIKNKVLLAKVAHGTTVSYPLRPPPRPPKKRLAAAAAAAASSSFEDEEM